MGLPIYAQGDILVQRCWMSQQIHKTRTTIGRRVDNWVENRKRRQSTDQFFAAWLVCLVAKLSERDGKETKA